MLKIGIASMISDQKWSKIYILKIRSSGAPGPDPENARVLKFARKLLVNSTSLSSSHRWAPERSFFPITWYIFRWKEIIAIFDKHVKLLATYNKKITTSLELYHFFENATTGTYVVFYGQTISRIYPWLLETFMSF